MTVAETIEWTAANIPSPMEAVQAADSALRATAKLAWSVTGVAGTVWAGTWVVKAAVSELVSAGAATVAYVGPSVVEGAEAAAHYTPQVITAVRTAAVANPIAASILGGIVIGGVLFGTAYLIANSWSSDEESAERLDDGKKVVFPAAA